MTLALHLGEIGVEFTMLPFRRFATLRVMTLHGSQSATEKTGTGHVRSPSPGYSCSSNHARRRSEICSSIFPCIVIVCMRN